MPVMNNAALARVYQEVRRDFEDAFGKVPRLWKAWGMEVPSSSRSTIQSWLSDMPQVREWLGPRIAKDLATRSWEIKNRKWELTIKLIREELEDDLVGTVASAQQKALSMGEEFGFHEDKLMAETLEAGLTSECFDGQYFFDTDHPIDPDDAGVGTYSNKMTTSALDPANYGTARTNMRKFKRENNLPMPGPEKLLLVVPPALEDKARRILFDQWYTPGTAHAGAGTSGPSENIYKGTAELQVNPYLTSDTRWFLFGIGSRVKPLIFQRREMPKVVRKDQETDDNVFFEDAYYYGGAARYAASYGLPQLAICADA